MGLPKYQQRPPSRSIQKVKIEKECCAPRTTDDDNFHIRIEKEEKETNATRTRHPIKSPSLVPSGAIELWPTYRHNVGTGTQRTHTHARASAQGPNVHRSGLMRVLHVSCLTFVPFLFLLAFHFATIICNLFMLYHCGCRV